MQGSQFYAKKIVYLNLCMYVKIVISRFKNIQTLYNLIAGCLQIVFISDTSPDDPNNLSLPVGFLLLRYSVLCTAESLSLLYILFIS